MTVYLTGMFLIAVLLIFMLRSMVKELAKVNDLLDSNNKTINGLIKAVEDESRSTEIVAELIISLSNKVTTAKPKFDIHNSTSGRVDGTKENKSQVPKNNETILCPRCGKSCAAVEETELGIDLEVSDCCGVVL